LRPAIAGDREAFGNLYLAYFPALLAYLRYKGNSHEHSMDLLQGFFAHLLATDGLGRYERKGRFRSWLLKGLNYFVTDEWRKTQSLKKGQGKTHLPIGADFESGEVEPLDPRLTPEQAYDRKWGITILTRVLAKLAEEYRAAGKEQLFHTLKAFIPGSSDKMGYAMFESSLGLSANAIAVTVKRMRERYRELLREEISRTVDPEMIDQEWQYLQETICGRTGTASEQFQA
jgi:RNA polymerase sigma-70 factor (ECF subfamily)